MAELSKIRKNGVDYDIKDSTARREIETLKQNGGSGGNVDQSQIAQAVEDYMEEHPSSGLTSELKTALKTYFTNMQTLITQMAFSTDTHIGATLISNAMAVVTALENSGSVVQPEQPDPPEQPEIGIVQMGNILAITSGVTVNQTGAVLALT